MRRPSALWAGVALLVVGAAGRWAASAHPGPRTGLHLGRAQLTISIWPELLLAVAYVLFAVGMLLDLRTRRPHSPAAWGVWLFTAVTVVLSSPLAALWIAQQLEMVTGLTDQDGPQWQQWPIVCLVLAAVLSQIVGRDVDRPAMTVAGLIAALLVSLRLSVFFFDGEHPGALLAALPWAAGALLIGFAVFAPRGRDRSGPDSAPRPWLAVGAALVAGAAAMIAAQLIRWHACLGWRWSSDPRSCGTIQDHRYDYVFPDSPPGLPSAAMLHGIGLLLVAAALVVALVVVARRPPTPVWGRVGAVGTGVLWALAVVVVAVPGIAGVVPSLKVADRLAPLVGLGLDPLLFMVLAGLVAVSGLERWERTRLVRLFAGLAVSTFFVEFSFWSGVYASFDTPPFTGLLRALVVLAVGVQLIRAPRSRERSAALS